MPWIVYHEVERLQRHLPRKAILPERKLAVVQAELGQQPADVRLRFASWRRPEQCAPRYFERLGVAVAADLRELA